MFLNVDRKQVGMEITECQLAVSSIGAMRVPIFHVCHILV